MEEFELMRAVADQGVLAIMFLVLLLFYRKDVKQYTDLWRTQSEMLMAVVKENTAAITANSEVTRSMHKRLDERVDRR